MNTATLKGLAKGALDTGKAVLVASKKKVESGYEYMQSVPDQMECPECGKIIPIPHSIFDWTCLRCKSTHPVEVARSTCPICKAAQIARSDPQYSVTCVHCDCSTAVYSTNAKMIANNVSKKSKEVYEQGKTFAVAEFKHVKIYIHQLT